MVGTNPISGSTSRLIWASRSARKSMRGIRLPFSTTVAIAIRSRVPAAVAADQSSGITPSAMPCRAAAWISARMRLVPSMNRFSSSTPTTSRLTAESRSTWTSSHARVSTKPNAQRTPAAISSEGT